MTYATTPGASRDDIVALVESMLQRPPSVRLEQIGRLVFQLAEEVRSLQAPTVLEMERVLISSELDDAPLDTVAAVLAMASEAEVPIANPDEVLRALPVAMLAEAFQVRPGNLTPDDVVQLAGLALRGSAGEDPLDDLLFHDVLAELSPSGRRALTMRALRRILEGIVATRGATTV